MKNYYFCCFVLYGCDTWSLTLKGRGRMDQRIFSKQPIYLQWCKLSTFVL